MAYKQHNPLALPINLSAYMNREKIVRDTPATCIEGNCFRMIGNELYTEKQFLAMYPPVKLIRCEWSKVIGQIINE